MQFADFSKFLMRANIAPIPTPYEESLESTYARQTGKAHTFLYCAAQVHVRGRGERRTWAFSRTVLRVTDESHTKAPETRFRKIRRLESIL